MQSLPKVLLVEDDRSIAATLCQTLASSYQVELASTGRQGIYKADREEYELVLLDLNLPDVHGLEVCQQLRERGQTTPVLILTGDGSVMSKISLLDAGANDYLTKPFSLGELKARLRTLSRQHKLVLGHSSDQLAACGLTLNKRTLTACREGATIYLRRKEFAILECLVEHAGSVVSRNLFSRYGWQDKDFIWTNTIDVHIKNLRDKIDKPFGQPLIHTVYGLGYKLDTKKDGAINLI